MGASTASYAATSPSSSACRAADAAGAIAAKIAEQGVACAGAVARDQLGVVEVVAGVDAAPGGQRVAQCDLVVGGEQRDLDAVDWAAVLGDERRRSVSVAVAMSVDPQ